MGNKDKYFYRDENGYDTHHLVLEKKGKFGKVIYHEFSGWIINSKSTEKSYAVGEWNPFRNKFDIWGFVAKSQVEEFEGMIFAPTWILDKLDWDIGSGRYSNNEQLYYRTIYNLDTQEIIPEIHNRVKKD